MNDIFIMPYRFYHLLRLITLTGLCISMQCLPSGTSFERPSTGGKKYFLSATLYVRDEVQSILQFMEHYIEEGVDHVYIFNDNSTDGTIEALSCLDSRYYSVMSYADCKKQYIYDSFRPVQIDIYGELFNHFDLARNTEWLINVDVDELITSRTNPAMSIRDILLSPRFRYSECGAISIPWLLYSWDDYISTASNTYRYHLRYRWGYDAKYQREIVHVPNVSPSKFLNKHAGVENKVIYRTNLTIDGHHGIHTVSFGGAIPQTVCIPRIEGHMHCSTNMTMERRKKLATMVQNPHKYDWQYADMSRRPILPMADIPRYCPFANRFRSLQSPKFTYLSEPDIESMQFLVFHFRVKSVHDLAFKGKLRRYNNRGYSNTARAKEEGNRLDVLDEFFQTVRLPQRMQHPDYRKAQLLFRDCPRKYYSNGTQARLE